ncbi:helix-turn-helix domain-containing protein [Escherichia coli]|uniref:helix-turn-helix domain-containing protein n=1 Tax=Escherichia TaxID=561 RepID=UPI000589F596|nr:MULTISPECIES: helix-turn-helix domain-containing protein [Escherichia]EHK6255515.1 helix-turn-helix domain-containing protein [Shigella flexneri]ELU0963603.1 helix-turn-helix domain-containing protein [Shigella boydii]EER7519646.1 helix-turn-helix domain-containing protein [Escherichia coli]EER8637850.1 helix-turn-helix domain-containing protein [Escherichia coli]EEU0476758.1 helix-turn-helix domain-containing protein [Escherichia coli]
MTGAKDIRRLREELIAEIKAKAKQMEIAAQMDVAEQMYKMVEEGTPRQVIAKTFGVGIATVHRRLKAYADYHNIERKEDGRFRKAK